MSIYVEVKRFELSTIACKAIAFPITPHPHLVQGLGIEPSSRTFQDRAESPD